MRDVNEFGLTIAGKRLHAWFEERNERRLRKKAVRCFSNWIHVMNMADSIPRKKNNESDARVILLQLTIKEAHHLLYHDYHFPEFVRNGIASILAAKYRALMRK